MQLARNGGNFSCVNPREVAAAAGLGAVIGAVLGGTLGLAAPEIVAAEEAGAAAAIESEIYGASSAYDTAGGMKGINTNVTAEEFSSTLQSNGYSATTTAGGKGPVTVLQKGQSNYTVYTRSSTGESGASYSGPSGQSSKFNLGR